MTNKKYLLVILGFISCQGKNSKSAMELKKSSSEKIISEYFASDTISVLTLRNYISIDSSDFYQISEVFSSKMDLLLKIEFLKSGSPNIVFLDDHIPIAPNIESGKVICNEVKKKLGLDLVDMKNTNEINFSNENEFVESLKAVFDKKNILFSFSDFQIKSLFEFLRIGTKK